MLAAPWRGGLAVGPCHHSPRAKRGWVCTDPCTSLYEDFGAGWCKEGGFESKFPYCCPHLRGIQQELLHLLSPP